MDYFFPARIRKWSYKIHYNEEKDGNGLNAHDFEHRLNVNRIEFVYYLQKNKIVHVQALGYANGYNFVSRSFYFPPSRNMK